jgi:hypothetical protein
VAIPGFEPSFPDSKAHIQQTIPVLVTGIQPPRVCAVNDSSVLKGIFRAMDMALLASL